MEEEADLSSVQEVKRSSMHEVKRSSLVDLHKFIQEVLTDDSAGEDDHVTSACARGSSRLSEAESLDSCGTLARVLMTGSEAKSMATTLIQEESERRESVRNLFIQEETRKSRRRSVGHITNRATSLRNRRSTMEGDGENSDSDVMASRVDPEYLLRRGHQKLSHNLQLLCMLDTQNCTMVPTCKMNDEVIPTYSKRRSANGDGYAGQFKRAKTMVIDLKEKTKEEEARGMKCRRSLNCFEGESDEISVTSPIGGMPDLLESLRTLQDEFAAQRREEVEINAQAGGTAKIVIGRRGSIRLRELPAEELKEKRLYKDAKKCEFLLPPLGRRNSMRRSTQLLYLSDKYDTEGFGREFTIRKQSQLDNTDRETAYETNRRPSHFLKSIEANIRQRFFSKRDSRGPLESSQILNSTPGSGRLMGKRCGVFVRDELADSQPLGIDAQKENTNTWRKLTRVIDEWRADIYSKIGEATTVDDWQSHYWVASKRNKKCRTIS
eukprot:GEMP01022112.1.p1 GENE.GEMP01022112.1~~GEMP01022112.1.p1  ORF type:complete len:494 (+),score=86.40 GEMP01022112.1:258-1739(+)